MRDCVDAGLDFYRFSFIGSNREQYDKWMYNRIGSNYDKIINNIRDEKIRGRKILVAQCLRTTLQQTTII